MEFDPNMILNALASAGAVYGAVRVELRWLRRDVDLAHKRITKLETRHVEKTPSAS